MGKIGKYLPDNSENQEPSIPPSLESVSNDKPQSRYKSSLIPRRQIIIAIVAAVIIVALVLVIGINIGIGIGTKHAPKAAPAALPTTRSQAYSEMEKVPDKPSNATDNAGFPAFSKDHHNPDAPTVELYTDFLCPYCGDVTRALTPTLEKLQAARQINLEIHPLNLYDTPSTDRYSVRAANAVAYVSEHDPNHVTAFVGMLFEKDFQPDAVHFKDVSDDDIAQQAIKAGVSEKIADEAVKAPYAKYISKATLYDTMRKELFINMNGTKGLFPPTIRINGKIAPLDTSDSDAKMVVRFTARLGLKPTDAGNPSIMPSIGGDPSAGF
ncbi:thioredoxin domain-containing protein [Bifidobacterium sp. ESL0728]|uniref:DsbA family protein n=1 Tax=Bifidobacterium sp. ESL0728 TaxID=2983220 RepID=UPI0023F6E7BF|nr:thioredoxin domain-containing protein [Bifidobacterium sp. ESL0728]WEV58427.1 thioredoxin domain-containing protein [Bifidobacterium sp. ESL0728]